MSNHVASLETLGVDPRDYSPDDYRTIGDYLRQMSSDFNQRLFQLRKETRLPITLVIVFVSESNDLGVLSQLTSSTRYGLLDGHALVNVTPRSELGKWWSRRPGLLTRCIVQLNAHAFNLPPGPAISILTTYGTERVREVLHSVGVKSSPSRVARDLSRSDFGKFLVGSPVHALETRGKPPETATSAYSLLAEEGFVYGKDKAHNDSMGQAILYYLQKSGDDPERMTAESKLDFCPIIPDNAIYGTSSVTCIEYTWRKSEYLTAANRAATAQYILGKLRDYARQLNWTRD
jgi:hypothetical protein